MMPSVLRLLAVLLTMIGLNRSSVAESKLVVSPDYRLSELSQMPRPSVINGLTLEQRDYPEQNAIEWQVSIHAPDSGDSPRFENLASADFAVQFPDAGAIRLHSSKGSHAEASDFAPKVQELVAGQSVSLESFGGRSSDGVMPYFNLATETGGLIFAIGWPGDWKASFEALPGSQVRIRAGLKRSDFRLSPGENLRLPSVLVMSYQGDWIDGQNRFRRLMLRHYTPTNHPPMELMPVAGSVHGMIGFNDTNEKNLTALFTDMAALQLPLDTFWLDAGWNENGFPGAQGNPMADPVRFPKGLSPVGEVAGKSGMRFLVWFEPERAMRGTWLDREHADWLLSPSGTPNELRYLETDGFRLLDLGREDARQWAVDNVSQHITEANISIYRQDFNSYPAYFWHTSEPADAAGLREVRYINGLYWFLDELAKRHPGLILDNCASGGRRFDFEMMRRSVVLWRSDSCWDDKTFPRNVQAMTHGLSHWTPLHGLGSLKTDDLALRSGMGACASYAANFRDPAAVANLRRHLDRYLPVRSLFTKDFYPLTAWTIDTRQWLGFQFHDPETGEGVVQAFCGSQESPAILNLKLRGINPALRYVVTDWDKPSVTVQRTGAELLESFEVRSEGSAVAKVWHYTVAK